MGADLFTCSCGRLERSLFASSHRDALRVFHGDMDMNAELVAGDKKVRIKGPVRSRHEGTLCEFDRETGEELRTIDLRPKKPRRR
jgi:hypothetical protein